MYHAVSGKRSVSVTVIVLHATAEASPADNRNEQRCYCGGALYEDIIKHEQLEHHDSSHVTSNVIFLLSLFVIEIADNRSMASDFSFTHVHVPDIRSTHVAPLHRPTSTYSLVYGSHFFSKTRSNVWFRTNYQAGGTLYSSLLAFVGSDWLPFFFFLLFHFRRISRLDAPVARHLQSRAVNLSRIVRCPQHTMILYEVPIPTHVIVTRANQLGNFYVSVLFWPVVPRSSCQHHYLLVDEYAQLRPLCGDDSRGRIADI